MAFRGKQMTFHGAFSSKERAVRKERDTAGAFIRKRRIRGRTRYVVMSRNR
jgi:hypothetical protein